MVEEHQRHHLAQEVERCEDVCADGGMAVDQLALFVGQTARLEQDCAVDTDFADVVKGRGDADLVHVGSIEAEGLGECDREGGDLVGVAGGVGVFGVDGRGEGGDRAQERVLEIAVEACVLDRHAQLSGNRGHHVQVLLGELLRCVRAAHAYHADDPVLGHDGSADRRGDVVAQQLVEEVHMRCVRKRKRTVIARNPPGDTLANGNAGARHDLVVDTGRRRDRQAVAGLVDEHDRSGVRAGDRHKLLERSVEYGFEIDAATQSEGELVEGGELRTRCVFSSKRCPLRMLMAASATTILRKRTSWVEYDSPRASAPG